MNTFNAKFNFRAIAAAASNFSAVVEQFKAKAIKFEESTTGEGDQLKVTKIKRETVAADLPLITSTEFDAIDPSFTQTLLNSVVVDAARKMFIDELMPVDLTKLTPAFVIEALATQRAAAIDKEQITAFSKFVVTTLEAAGTAAGTVGIIKDMIDKKFGRQVLNTYSRFEPQFQALLAKAVNCLEGQTPEVVNEHTAVIELLAKNLEVFSKREEVLELDLS